MRFSGTIYKDGKFWLAEIPILDLMTQGRTKKEAYEMIADRMGTTSRNSYARYEQGKSVPSMEKLNELLHAVCPQTDIVINESSIP
ncbi:MAG: helix-turn-helix transcriptional regulator [Desulfobacula sp.]|jgi:transcriptional regulator with XRE-family HTH domain